MTEQTFSFETVACLIAVLESNNVVLGQRHYDLMAKLDGNRSGCGFQHQFRKVKARAKELQSELGGGKAVSTPRKAKSVKKETNGTAESKKRKKQGDGKLKHEDDHEEQVEPGDEPGPTEDTAAEKASPSKKAKLEKPNSSEEELEEFFSYETGNLDEWMA